MTDPQNDKDTQKTQGSKAEPQESQDKAQEAPEKQDAPESQDPTLDLKKLILEQENRYKYLYADFENFKKRAFKERTDAAKFGWESVALEMLQVMDNFERATAHGSSDENLLMGLKMIMTQLEGALKIGGVEPIPSEGEFDPQLHEAVGQEPSDQPENTILRVESKGYKIHGRLLRPARVIVSSGQAGSTEKK